ncbi:MAG: hypothetical protein CL908_01615 [Deltaproteobacteria bacterium]|nr:hypothetical protein [Deltaproteobacteria bacterium]
MTQLTDPTRTGAAESALTPAATRRAPLAHRRGWARRPGWLGLGVAMAIALLAGGLSGSDASAACNPDPPADDDVVTCDGSDSTGYDGSGATRLDITNSGVTALDESDVALDSAIRVGDDNTVDFDADVTIAVTEDDGFGIRGDDRNDVDVAGTIDVDAANGVGIRVGNDGTVDNTGDITITTNANGGVGIEGGNDNDLTNGATGTITINATGGIAILGANDNIATNDGTITLDADDTRAISIGRNTTGILPNGAVNSGDMIINGARSYGLEAGDDSGIANLGDITLSGDETRGISAGSRTDFTRAANLTHSAGHTIDVLGDDAFGIKAGDQWIMGQIDAVSGEFDFDDSGAGTRNFGSINVSGERSFGLFVGDETNSAGNNNSFVLNDGTIDVTGTDSTGISLGGNDLLPRLEFDDPDRIFQFDLTNSGTITGDDDAGPLVEFRAFVSGYENRFLNQSSGELLADLTNQGMTNRAIAVRGSAGDDYVLNVGTIQGDIEFGAGDDRYLQTPAATLTATSRLYGGAGTDELVLDVNSGSLASFDVSALDEFESIRILGGSTGWELTNASGFSGVTTIDLNGRLEAPTPLLLGGDLMNEGAIDGDIDFGAGDDLYTHTRTATLTGTLFGGAGVDELVLDTNDGSLTSFDVSALDGFESIRIRQGATGWELTNASGFSGVTTVEAGARLQAPTPMTLGGDLVVDSAGTVEVTLDDTGPPITVLGDADFAGTLVLNRGSNLTGSPTPYRVIQVNGLVTGTFDVFDAPSVGRFTFTESYDAMGLLVLFEDTGFAGVAQGQNRRAIARHLDAIDAAGGASPDLENMIRDLTASTGNLNGAYDTLSPEAYDAQTTLLVEGGRRVAQLLFDRPRECEPGRLDPWTSKTDPLPCHARRWAPWVATVGAFRSREKFAGHPRYDAQLGGAVLGVDARPIAGLDLTFALASQRGKVDVARAGESTLTLVDLAAHAAWTQGPVRVQGAFSWGHGFHDDRRIQQFQESASTVNATGTDDHESDRILLAAEVGALFDIGPLGVEPLIGFDWSWVSQDTIRESQAGGLGLRVGSRDDAVGSVNAGIRLSTFYEHHRYLGQNLEWMDGIWRPTVDLRWRQLLGDNERDIDARLVGSPDTAAGFTIQGKEDTGGFEVGAGLSFVPENANRLEIELRYEAFVSSHTLAQDLVARLTFGF